MNKKDMYGRIRPLISYFKEFGTIDNIKQNQEYEVNGEIVKIGWIVANLRQDKKRGSLSHDLIEILDYMGMNWGKTDFFERKKKILLAWYLENKTLGNLTQYSKFQYGDELVDIGTILSQLRQEKKNGQLSSAQIELLDNLGIVWAPKDKQSAYDSLVKYKEMFGTIADIRTNDKIVINGEEVLIGRQISHLRSRYNKGMLDQEEIEFFESLGIDWGKRSISQTINMDEKTQ